MPRIDAEQAFSSKVTDLKLKYQAIKRGAQNVGIIGTTGAALGIGGSFIGKAISTNKQARKLTEEVTANDVKAAEKFSGKKFVLQSIEGETKRDYRSRLLHQQQKFINDFLALNDENVKKFRAERKITSLYR